ncbi:MAG: amidophosphoribosyltransferase [Gammaproteobacteria bacterium RIFCSPLOWO2_02_FULL_42_14]|nr:MAG: amidophosphoribosyltransferase [Gammaproteobacteria bacterium RIFCSPHIGHO2_02_FULL_42_43]OGT50753.1 MAG: amidophosphoribosyltransferase [Gammaproteobacteria bacterium RIFCSPHIGHO2_12_FULL_41_25]OGT61738.1 MAG: amidophosphoribosyltransferase [Gammaproteobacteria bacterium RIFCSPLOWO2_02_FULL_42_14]OGT85482.1 MAG: amidophosphoribosyltransferase [Gammaproteobacteria bacterium RIFCSPLOWO2_12_FULL_42_18]
MCGIVGIVSQKSVALELYDSLIQLQHRGQAATGIITVDQKLNMKLGKGLVREVFKKSDFEMLTGNMGIAHVRYPTAGDSGSLAETQPFWLGFPYGMAMGHNGNLINYDALKKILRTQYRRHLNTKSDSEALIHLISAFLEEAEIKKPNDDFFARACDAIQNVFENAKGSYSTICAIANKGMLAFRDPHGVRPLLMARRGEQDYIISSENTPFFSLGFKICEDIQPGELIFIDLEGNLKRKKLVTKDFHPCIFEYVYFARPDAVLDEVSVYRARLNLGTRLAKAWREKYPNIIPDVIVPVPFTSNTAALSFAREINVPYSEGLYKNPFIGRTFIMPNQQMRRYSVRHKLSPQAGEIQGKKVLLLDDSIVRGTTSKEIVRMVREMNAKEVYLVSTSPPIKYPCYYGIDIPTSDELIANQMNLDRLKAFLDLDVLLYQTEKDLVEAITENKPNMKSPCMACMNQQYFCGTPPCSQKTAEIANV